MRLRMREYHWLWCQVWVGGDGLQQLVKKWVKVLVRLATKLGRIFLRLLVSGPSLWQNKAAAMPFFLDMS